MGFFEGEIEKAAVVALFVPLIISSGGNSGSQGTSLIIRSLAIRELKLADWWRVFGRELRTGLALGCFLGLIGFLRIAAWQGLSQAPVIGGFFRTHSGSSAPLIPEGMKMAKYEIPVHEPLVVGNLTLPPGTLIAKGQLVPESLDGPHVVDDDGKPVLDKDKKPVDPYQHASAKVVPSAYGEFWIRIGLTVFFALIGVVAWGSLAGSMLPFLLRRIGFDPATSSAPFVATLVDVTGLIIYFLVAKAILTGTVM